MMRSIISNISPYILTLIFTIIFATTLNAQVFTFGGRYGTDAWPECVVTGNFNNDGYADIAVSHRDAHVVLIYINDGSNSFSQDYSFELSQWSGLYAADFNNDGLDDLASFDTGRVPPYESGTTVRLNNGDGTFDISFQDTLGWGWEYMCVADLNNDNKSDILVYQGYDGIGFWVFFGKGDGSFNEPAMIKSFPSLPANFWFATADLENDGDVDIIYVSGQETFSMLNQGNSQFDNPILGGETMSDMAIADLNGDEFPDLIGTGNYACSGTPHYMLGNGDGTFGLSKQAWMTAGVMLKNWVISADFNSDGYGDIAFYSYDLTELLVGLNDGRQFFRDIISITEVDESGGIYTVAEDFDNDGDMDVALTGRDDTLTVIISLGAQHTDRILVPDDIPTIGEAIDYAWNLDTIEVMPGMYVENIDFGGKNLVMMSSDFANNKSSSNQKATIQYSESTIIDGGGIGSVFVFDDGEDERSIVAGFTIQNGYTDIYGAGIRVVDSIGPTIMNNIIRDNHSSNVAGGIFVHKETIIKNNLIIGNTSASVGGGVYLMSTDGDFVNNTVYGNSAETGGGGLFYNYGSPFICNNVFWNNSSTTGSNEIHYMTDPPVIIYSDVQGGWPGEGNFNLDPMFVDPDNGDFNLLINSPCINSGDPNGPLDPDGSIADLGAFYYPVPTNLDDVVGNNNLPSSFDLEQNYPNPFNPNTIINYSLPSRSHVRIEVFNLLGQKVRLLKDSEVFAGYHQIIWDGLDESGNKVSTGVYLYRIQAGDFIKSKKMMLLK